jgi:hypothetical protein
VKKRCVGCHSTCEDYLRDKQEWEDAKEKYRESKKKEKLINDYQIESHRKQMKVERGKKR